MGRSKKCSGKKQFASSHKKNVKLLQMRLRKRKPEETIAPPENLQTSVDGSVIENIQERRTFEGSSSFASKASCSSATSTTETVEIDLEGRRIVDIGNLFKQIFSISNHPPFDCTIGDMYVCKEVRKGLASLITLKCRMCGVEKTLNSDQPSEKNIGINQSMVLATISTGIGYSTSQELVSVLNVPFMSAITYRKYHNSVADIVHNAAWKTMEECGVEEALLARNLGEVGKDNIPFITVVADGAWCKRSYNVNYDASSGVACIIGQRTGKLLFLGIRNKYCSICARCEAKNIEKSVHTCYKNWSNTSTSMESDIIVEGFKRSIEQHGLKYLKLVGDGDSSVHKKLLEARPYGNILVQKIECRNHLLRNFSSKIRELCSKKRSTSKNLPVSPYLRKIVQENSMRMRTAISKAVLFRNGENTEFEDKVRNLIGDIENAPSHVFGEHKECSNIQYFKYNPKQGEKNWLPEMRECGLFEDLKIILNRLIYHSSSLINNMSNNLAEQYNSVICKFVGGKRINFAMRGSYQTRCEAASISFNNDYYETLFRELTTRSPPRYTALYKQRIRKQRLYNRRKIYLKKRKLRTALPDADYGPQASTSSKLDDLPMDEFEAKRKLTINNLNRTNSEICAIEKQTRGQSGNPLWHQERVMRLTASHFGDICKMRPNTSPVNKIKNMLYSKFLGNKCTKYGIEHERVAIADFEKQFGMKVQPCGLFIDPDNGIFAASPDGLVGNSGIVEIKCPSTAAKLSPAEAIKKKN